MIGTKVKIFVFLRVALFPNLAPELVPTIFGLFSFGTKGEIRPGNHVSPFLSWGDFHARSRFARSTLPEEKWGTTRSLGQPGQPGSCEEALNPLNPEIKI